MNSRDRERSQQGTIMVLVLAILAALLAAGAAALYLQVAATRSLGAVRSARSSLYCAEAGLAAARSVVGDRYPDWAEILDGDALYPDWYLGPDGDPGIEGDIDGDGEADYVVRIEDNDDELAPGSTNDKTKDNDLRVYLISRCTRFSRQPREVMELVEYEASSGCQYRDQGGQGCANSGNAN